MNIKRLAIGGGKFYPSHYFAQSRVRRRANLLSFSTQSSLLFLFLFASALLAGCADADILQPSSPMTRADSIAAGLLVPVPTADGAWDGETVYDFDGNPIGQGSDTQIAVGGVDSDLDSPWGE